MTEPDKNADINYETMPAGMAMDETDINLRAHFSRMTDDKLAEYESTWTDDELTAWDEDFRDDGTLFLVCCERDVDVEEYRKVLVEHIRFRFTDKAKK